MEGLRFWGIPILFALLMNGLLISFIPGLVSPISERKPTFESIPGFRMIRIKPPVHIDQQKIFPKTEPVRVSDIQPLSKQTPLKVQSIPSMKLDLKTDLPKPDALLELPDTMDFTVPQPNQLPRRLPRQLPRKSIYATKEIDSPLMPLVRIPPAYPRNARRRGIQGWVDIEFVIGRTGNVETVRVINAKPEGVYEKSVIRAVSRWRFTPGKVEGKAVRIRVRQRLQFRLGHETD